MSLRSRILARAGTGAAAVRLVPKDRGAGSAFGLRRMDAPEPEPEQEAAPLRRSTAPAPDAAPKKELRRDRKDEPEDMAHARRSPAPPSADTSLARSTQLPPEEPEADVARKVIATEGPVAASTDTPPVSEPAEIPTTSRKHLPAFRDTSSAPPEEEPEPEAAKTPAPQRAISAQPQAAPAITPTPTPNVAPQGGPVPAQTAPEALQGRTSETAMPPIAPGEAAEAPGPTEAPVPLSQSLTVTSQAEPFPGFPLEHHSRAQAVKAAPERPKVIIDQIDVVIADSAPARAPTPAQSSASSLLARRWLRR